MKAARAMRTTIAVFALASAVAPAGAIIMRHDVNEARYFALGEAHRPLVVQLALHASADGAPLLYNGIGTLIAPDWVVTAAHAAEYLQQALHGAPLSDHFVYVAGRGYRVAQVVIHPGYAGPDGGAHDIALIRLAAPVQHEVTPACLYQGEDERDRIVTLAGTGYAGDGLHGPRAHADGGLRGATVRVDAAEGNLLTWHFRPPRDPRTTPLEGISGPGDSGGPAFIQVGARTCIAGVSSAQRREVTPGQPDSGEGHYGVEEVYMRVSHFRSWIEATIRRSH